MTNLSKNQIDYIRNDVKARGVTSKDLLDQLTDHLACIMEEKDFTEDRFFAVYDEAVKEFVSSNFLFIQNLTNQFITKKSMQMKAIKVIWTSLLCYAVFLFAISYFLGHSNARDGDVLKSAGFLICGGAALLCAYYFIRYKINSLNLRIMYALIAYGCNFLLTTFALRGLNTAAGDALMQVLTYVLMAVAAFSMIFYWRHKTISGMQ